MARLSGAQDDAHQRVGEVLADLAGELQAGVVALHDHVEQDDGRIRVLLQQRVAFGGGVGRIQRQRPAAVGDVAQGEASHRVHVGFVVDDQDLHDGGNDKARPAKIGRGGRLTVTIRRPAANPQQTLRMATGFG